MKTEKKYFKQWNYCVSLLRRTKRKYYSRLDEKSITDNEKFWRTVKPVLWDKTPFDAKITLIEDGKLLLQITKEPIFWILLNLVEFPVLNPYYNKVRDPILKAIVKYKDNPIV